MSNPKNNDRLAKLAKDDTTSAFCQSVKGLKNQAIRNAFADAIEARVSDRSVCALIATLARETDLTGDLASALKLSNASALRQQLEHGFALPATGKRAGVDLSNL